MDILKLTALEQARLVATRTVSSEELTRFYLGRIERLNPMLNAFVSVFARGAVREARRKDDMVRHGLTLPPFHGVPMGIKDLNMVRGRLTRLGSRACAVILPVDDHVVRRLRAAGFVFLGKLATSELGAMPVTEPDIHPPTRNPWNPAHTPGGSSGGSGAAVAAGLLPMAHGSDGGGSIRIPSSFCHLFGFKASRGRVPNAYGYKDPNVLYTCGPLARTVDDAAAMLDTLLVPSSQPGLRALSETPPPPLRIRFVTRTPVASATPAIDAAVRAAVKTVEALGHSVDEGPPPEGTLAEFLPVWQRLVADSARLALRRMQPVTEWLAHEGRAQRRDVVARTQQDLTDRIHAWWGEADVWITPSVPGPPPRIGAFGALPPAEAFSLAGKLGAFTALFNISGQPAASIPLGLDDDGLPMGLQVAARRGQDATLMALCRQVETALPWRERVAPAMRAP